MCAGTTRDHCRTARERTRPTATAGAAATERRMDANDHEHLYDNAGQARTTVAEDQNLRRARVVVNRFRKKVFVDFPARGAIRMRRIVTRDARRRARFSSTI